MRDTMRKTGNEGTVTDDTTANANVKSTTDESPKLSHIAAATVMAGQSCEPSNKPQTTIKWAREQDSKSSKEGAHFRSALARNKRLPPPSPSPRSHPAITSHQAAAATSEGELLAALCKRVKKGIAGGVDATALKGAPAELLADLHSFARSSDTQNEGDAVAAAYRRGQEKMKARARRNAERAAARQKKGNEAASAADAREDEEVEGKRSAEIWKTQRRAEEYERVLLIAGNTVNPIGVTLSESPDRPVSRGAANEGDKKLHATISTSSASSSSSTSRHLSADSEDPSARAPGARLAHLRAELVDTAAGLSGKLKTAVNEQVEKRDAKKAERQAAAAAQRRMQLKRTISAPLETKEERTTVYPPETQQQFCTLDEEDEEAAPPQHQYQRDIYPRPLLPDPGDSFPPSPAPPETLNLYRRAFSADHPRDSRATHQTSLADFMGPPTPRCDSSFSPQQQSAGPPRPGHLHKLSDGVKNLASTIRGYGSRTGGVLHRPAPSDEEEDDDASVYCVGIDGAPELGTDAWGGRAGSEEEYEHALAGCASAYGLTWKGAFADVGETGKNGGRVDSGLETAVEQARHGASEKRAREASSTASSRSQRRPGLVHGVEAEEAYVPPRSDWKAPASGAKESHNSYYALLEDDRRRFLWI